MTRPLTIDGIQPDSITACRRGDTIATHTTLTRLLDAQDWMRAQPVIDPVARIGHLKLTTTEVDGLIAAVRDHADDAAEAAATDCDMCDQPATHGHLCGACADDIETDAIAERQIDQ